MVQFDNAVNNFGKLILTKLKDNDITCWVAGGAVRDYFMGNPTQTDYDIFFPDQKEFDKAKVFFQNNGAVTEWESDNGMKLLYGNRTYDLIKKYFATPKDTIEAFDFTVSMFAVDCENVYHGESSFIDLAKKQLMINIVTYPESTMKRALKYYEKGFRMCSGELRRLIEALQSKVVVKNLPETPLIEGDDSEAPVHSSGDGFFDGID